MRKINLSNDTKRDAEVAFGTTFHRPTPVYKTADGKKSVNERRVRATMKTTDEALLAQYGEGLADALIAGDPEVDMEQFGLKVEGLKKICENLSHLWSNKNSMEFFNEHESHEPRRSQSHEFNKKGE